MCCQVLHERFDQFLRDSQEQVEQIDDDMIEIDEVDKWPLCVARLGVDCVVQVLALRLDEGSFSLLNARVVVVERALASRAPNARENRVGRVDAVQQR